MSPTSSFAITGLLALGGLLGLIVLFMFGSAVLEAIGAVVRMVLDTVGALFRAVGWYVVGVMLILAVGGGWLGYIYWLKPGTLKLASLRPPICTELLDRKGRVLDYVCPFDGVRVWRPIETIGTNLRMLIVMLEDDRFYEHAGLDFDEIINAIDEDLEKKKLARGASTITQQLAKNLFLSKEKSFIRKASEVPLTMRLEKELTKDQILELYLNTIEWGPGVYGAEAASRLYFDHDAASLKDEEAWLLALMVPNPRELNLWIAPKAKKSLLSRAQRLAVRLYQEHRMSKDEAKQAFARFSTFIDTWSGKQPQSLRLGRRYPARWGLTKDFSLAQISSIRRGSSTLMKKINHGPLTSHLDLELQQKLEEVQDAAVRVHDLTNVVALMDGEEIRALVPISKTSQLESVSLIGAPLGLKAQVFPARSIPSNALWP